MEVILLEKIHNLGKMGDTVTVKPGFGRNYLIPQRKALPATEQYVAEFQKRRVELEKIEAAKLAEALSRQAVLETLALRIVVKTGEEGRLFGSVSTLDIVEAVEKLGHAIERSEVRLPHGPIRELGVYSVELDLGSEVIAVIRVEVESDTAVE